MAKTSVCYFRMWFRWSCWKTRWRRWGGQDVGEPESFTSPGVSNRTFYIYHALSQSRHDYHNDAIIEYWILIKCWLHTWLQVKPSPSQPVLVILFGRFQTSEFPCNIGVMVLFQVTLSAIKAAGSREIICTIVDSSVWWHIYFWKFASEKLWNIIIQVLPCVFP